jgi:hypothetical protein
VGFVSTVVGVNYPPALALQYIAVATAIGAGSYAITRGIIIEPPPFLTVTLPSMAERLLQQVQAKLRPAT